MVATTSGDRNPNRFLVIHQMCKIYIRGKIRRKGLKRVKLKYFPSTTSMTPHPPQTAVCQMIQGMIHLLPDPALQDTSLGTCRDWLLWILYKVMPD